MAIFSVLSQCQKGKINKLLEVHIIVIMHCVVMFESTMPLAQDGCLEPGICLGNAAVQYSSCAHVNAFQHLMFAVYTVLLDEFHMILFDVAQQSVQRKKSLKVC